MTNNQDLFKELDRTAISKVKIGNGDYIDVKGKGIVVLNSLSGLKYISDVLYVPDIDLSVGQLMEKGFKVMFKDQWCLIKDNLGNKVFRVKIKAKGLMYMQKHTLVKGVPQLENRSANCATCQYRKQVKLKISIK
jgi:hypothetical protein